MEDWKVQQIIMIPIFENFYKKNRKPWGNIIHVKLNEWITKKANEKKPVQPELLTMATNF